MQKKDGASGVFSIIPTPHCIWEPHHFGSTTGKSGPKTEPANGSLKKTPAARFRNMLTTVLTTIFQWASESHGAVRRSGSAEI